MAVVIAQSQLLQPNQSRLERDYFVGNGGANGKWDVQGAPSAMRTTSSSSSASRSHHNGRIACHTELKFLYSKLTSLLLLPEVNILLCELLPEADILLPWNVSLPEADILLPQITAHSRITGSLPLSTSRARCRSARTNVVAHEFSCVSRTPE